MARRFRKQIVRAGSGGSCARHDKGLKKTPGGADADGETSYKEVLASQAVNSPYLVWPVLAAALIYAFLAGFRTVHDYDIGWQLATGRWIASHHQIPSTDVFSYTAKGKPWIYPVLSGLLFYAIYSLGGYAALTWLTATASAVTTYFLTRQRTLATAVLAIMAVPVVMTRLDPRADLFSTVLFAGLLSMLWKFHRTGEGKLWLMPVILLLWVNLHWGFVAGLGLCAAYVLLEIGEMPFAKRREPAKQRLKRAWPYLAGAAFVTILNPWGLSIYEQVFTWSNDLAAGASAKTEATITLEYVPLKWNWTTLEGALAWRNPGLSGIWWLLAIAFVAILLCLARKKYAYALLLAASAAAAAQRYRFEGMFACLLVVVGGAILDDCLGGAFNYAKRTAGWSAALFKKTVAFAGLSILLLAGVRSFDLVSDRYYLNSLPFEFGTGLSWWYPERAMEFVERERLPGNIYNPLVLGGFLAWRLPQYPDFIDGRGRPFEGEVSHADQFLPLQGPESPAWQQEAVKRDIKMIIVPTSRISGLEYFPRFQEFCDGQAWRPVYLDEVSAVFLRRSPETQAIIDRLQLDCKSVHFSAPRVDGSSRRGRADLFNFWTNSAVTYLALARPEDAIEATDAAQNSFEASAHLHLERGTALLMLNKPAEAESEFRRSIELEPQGENWYELAKLLWSEGHLDEATTALRKAAELSLQPEGLYFDLAHAELRRQHPTEALAAFDKAERFDRKSDDATTPEVNEFHAQVAEGRASAWMLLGDTERAADYEERALKLTPENENRWRTLAGLYKSLGRTSEAENALEKAQELSAEAARKP
jgi:tetratricopeptide (TPR) repeat protein